MNEANTILLGQNTDTDTRYLIDCTTSQRILVCGKTGTGKSYTLGVLVEELVANTHDTVLLVDPQGIFWCMSQKNATAKETEPLWEYEREPQGFDVNLLVPGDPDERYGDHEIVTTMQSRGITITPLRINPADLSPEMWLELFGLDINELQGGMFFKTVRECGQNLGRDFFLDDMAAQVKKARGLDTTKEALLRKIEMAHDWQLFEGTQYHEVWETLKPGAVNVLDLSVLDQGRYGLRNLVLAVLARFIFRIRTIARRREGLGLSSDTRKIWLAIDEAHNFCPSGSSTLSKEILIRWAKEGRQPGLSLIVASQQPAALDSEILTQCGIRIVHRITSKEDYRAIDALSQDFLTDGLSARIKQLSHPGETLVIDDLHETVIPVRVRPRQSQHGGASA
jgi:DNA helicase HerA-like ATPase